MRLLCWFTAMTMFCAFPSGIMAQADNPENPPGKTLESADTDAAGPGNEAAAQRIDKEDASARQPDIPTTEGETEEQAPPPDFSAPDGSLGFYCPIHGFHAQADVGRDNLLDLILPPGEPVPN